ncbi:MAG: hypothetical protein K0S41_1846 [Anaerocolumna sp.]|jgi:hypothetical protein|nr:hypothetical protein [Anaerocolumna sp.]
MPAEQFKQYENGLMKQASAVTYMFPTDNAQFIDSIEHFDEMNMKMLESIWMMF